MKNAVCNSDSVYLASEPKYQGVVVTPARFNWKEQPVLVPPKPAPLRQGAEDALRLKSRGVPT